MKNTMMHKTKCNSASLLISTHVFLSGRFTDVGSKESLKQMVFFSLFLYDLSELRKV